MVSKEVLQRAVLKAIEAKIRALGGPEKDVSGRFYFSKDFVSLHTTIGKELTPDAFVSALLAVEEEMEGRFELKSAQYESVQPWLNQGLTSVDHDPSEQDHFWEFEYFKEARKMKKSGDPTPGFYIFYLSKTGKLSRLLEAGEESIKLEKDKTAHKLLLTLRDEGNSEFIETSYLVDRIGTSEKTIYNQVGKIRKAVDENFKGIQSDYFIESETNAGYRLGKKIKIKDA